MQFLSVLLCFLGCFARCSVFNYENGSRNAPGRLITCRVYDRAALWRIFRLSADASAPQRCRCVRRVAPLLQCTHGHGLNNTRTSLEGILLLSWSLFAYAPGEYAEIVCLVAVVLLVAASPLVRSTFDAHFLNGMRRADEEQLFACCSLYSLIPARTPAEDILRLRHKF